MCHSIQTCQIFPHCFDFNLNLKAHLTIYNPVNHPPNLCICVIVFSCVCVFIDLIFLAHLTIFNPVNPPPDSTLAAVPTVVVTAIGIRNKTNTIYPFSSIRQTLTQ